MPRIPWFNPLRALPGLLLPALFLTFLFLPLADSIFGFAPEVELGEKRKLAPVPKLSGQGNSLKTFPVRFEKYYDDNFGFRGFLAYWHNYFKLFWLGSSPTDRVILGKDGWLFYGEEAARNSYQRLVTLSEEECADWTESLRLINDWLSVQGIPFVVMVPPNKSTVYGEYMPDSVRTSTAPPLIDQFVECSMAGGVEVLDFRGEMLEVKEKLPLYPSTESHWGPAGAHLAYRKVMETLAERLGGFDLGVPSSLRLGGEEDFTGDLAGMAGLNDLSEKRPQVLLEGDFDTTWVSEGAVRFGMNFTMETAREDLPRAVLYRDSFATQLIPLLAPHFRRLRTLWSYRFSTGVIEEEKPDIVLLEIVERYLTLGPDVLGKFSKLTADIKGVHAASDLPMRVGANLPDEGSSFGVIRSARGDTPPGWLVFGPYTWAPPGSHEATFRMRAGGRGVGSLARIEVTADKGERTLAQKVVSLEDFRASPEWTEFDLAFKLRHEASDIEYRVEYFGGGNLDVDTIRFKTSRTGCLSR